MARHAAVAVALALAALAGCDPDRCGSAGVAVVWGHGDLPAAPLARLCVDGACGPAVAPQQLDAGLAVSTSTTGRTARLDLLRGTRVVASLTGPAAPTGPCSRALLLPSADEDALVGG